MGLLKLFIERPIPAKPVDEPISLRIEADVTLESALTWLKLEIATVFSTCLTLDMDRLLYALLIT